MLGNISSFGRVTDVTLNMLSSSEILLRKLLVSFISTDCSTKNEWTADLKLYISPTTLVVLFPLTVEELCDGNFSQVFLIMLVDKY